ncbi:hypothetical protein QVD17_28231 [Tagetes erecta]|uniref:Uncharacterized protein n=1 Tax=Tagetes erecta TaxID=13708 RepID=A0AAD8NRW6_TARER|nr:hypothetical protein QVD17_28231 [Tagetes erecta]
MLQQYDRRNGVKAASGEDLVPDVGFAGNSRVFGEDTKMEYTGSSPEQTSDHNDFAANNADLESSTRLQFSDPESH